MASVTRCSRWRCSSSSTCCCSPASTPAERKRVGVIVVFFLCAAMFWAGFEQAATTLQPVRRSITPIARCSAAGSRTACIRPLYQSANPLFIIIFAPVFAWIWVRSARAISIRPRRSRSDSASCCSAWLPRDDAGPPSSWSRPAARSRPPGCSSPTCSTPSASCACSPVGLSNVTKLAPREIRGPDDGHRGSSATALGNNIAGQIAGDVDCGRGRAGMPGQFLHDAAGRRRSAALVLLLLVAAGSAAPGRRPQMKTQLLISPRALAAAAARRRRTHRLPGSQGSGAAAEDRAPDAFVDAGEPANWSSSIARSTPRAGRSRPTSPSTRST